MKLVGCFLDFKAARILFEACNRLQSLSYSQLDNDIHDVNEALHLEDITATQSYEQLLLNPQTLIATLESCKDTLEDLQITIQGPNGRPIDARIKFSGLKRFTHLASLTIQARHLGNFLGLPPALKHLRILFGGPSRPSAQLIPPDVADLVHEAIESQRTHRHSLKSVIFEGPFKTEEWEKDVGFHSDSAAGRWVIYTDVEAPGSLVWRLGDVDFTLRSNSIQQDKLWRWKIS